MEHRLSWSCCCRSGCGRQSGELSLRRFRLCWDNLPPGEGFTVEVRGKVSRHHSHRLAMGTVALSPSRAHSWLVSGWVRVWAGEPEVAIEHFYTSLRVDPRGLRPMHALGIGIARFFSRRFDDALPLLHASRQELPNFGETY